MTVCAHHRQRLGAYRLLPCAQPECPQSQGSVMRLVVRTEDGERQFLRIAVTSGDRRRWLWREVAAA